MRGLKYRTYTEVHSCAKGVKIKIKKKKKKASIHKSNIVDTAFALLNLPCWSVTYYFYRSIVKQLSGWIQYGIIASDMGEFTKVQRGLLKALHTTKRNGHKQYKGCCVGSL